MQETRGGTWAKLVLMEMKRMGGVGICFPQRTDETQWVRLRERAEDGR